MNESAGMELPLKNGINVILCLDNLRKRLEECGDQLDAYIVEEAISILKAQEPVEPYTKRDRGTTFFLCGGCNKPLCIAKDSYKPKHCQNCGKKVKWH